MRNKQDKISNIFSSLVFPDIKDPIAYSSDSPNLTKYMKRLATDKSFLEEEAKNLGKEVSEMLEELEEKGIIK
ncbi:MAG: hypothetical protein JJW00_08105 [Sulfurimonas sp.]|nr:hypothetical protein [Sulfurimonas sp.]